MSNDVFYINHYNNKNEWMIRFEAVSEDVIGLIVSPPPLVWINKSDVVNMIDFLQSWVDSQGEKEE